MLQRPRYMQHEQCRPPSTHPYLLLMSPRRTAIVILSPPPTSSAWTSVDALQDSRRFSPTQMRPAPAYPQSSPPASMSQGNSSWTTPVMVPRHMPRSEAAAPAPISRPESSLSHWSLSPDEEGSSMSRWWQQSRSRMRRMTRNAPDSLRVSLNRSSTNLIQGLRSFNSVIQRRPRLRDTAELDVHGEHESGYSGDVGTGPSLPRLQRFTRLRTQRAHIKQLFNRG